jgi:hypothetical protein
VNVQEFYGRRSARRTYLMIQKVGDSSEAEEEAGLKNRVG